MIFEWMSDPSAWVGLATLVVLEIVLGIDNLVFIAILAEKLPPEQRNTARIVGLILALGMRLILLASIAWLLPLPHPYFIFSIILFPAEILFCSLVGCFCCLKAPWNCMSAWKASSFRKRKTQFTRRSGW